MMMMMMMMIITFIININIIIIFIKISYSSLCLSNAAIRLIIYLIIVKNNVIDAAMTFFLSYVSTFEKGKVSIKKIKFEVHYQL